MTHPNIFLVFILCNIRQFPIQKTPNPPTAEMTANIPFLDSRQRTQALRSCQDTVKVAILNHSRRINVISSSLPLKGLENITVAEVLLTKGAEKPGPCLSCRTDDYVDDAFKNMADNNIESLFVLKPGEQQLIAGIITEKDYMRKIIATGRSPRCTRVGEIMTAESKLITVASDTNILQAMQLMTENQIRHVPVIDGKIVGMVSIVDVVRAVVEQQSGEVKHLNQFIKGDYY